MPVSLPASYNPLFAGVVLQATTPTTGVALINGTQDFLTWTAPNDGNLHRILVFGNKITTVNETGGTISAVLPPSINTTVIGATTAGTWPFGVFGGAQFYGCLVPAATQFKISQTAALTAGASKFYGEIWGS